MMGRLLSILAVTGSVLLAQAPTAECLARQPHARKGRSCPTRCPAAFERQKIAQALDDFRNATQQPEYSLSLHRLLEIDPTGNTVLPVASQWLISEDWLAVDDSRDVFLNYQEHSIPYLLKIMQNDRRVKLRNTLDLIYPGATTFYGHGGIVDYDIDDLRVRAGWILEGIAFQDFGFRLGMISEDTLPYTFGDVPLKDVQAMRFSTQAEVEAAVSRAQAWWKDVNRSWTRFGAIKGAITSGNTHRQLTALSYIRFGYDPCSGLSPDSYNSEILPMIQRLAKSSDATIAEQARMLLDDDEQWWWRNKEIKLIQEDYRDKP